MAAHGGVPFAMWAVTGGKDGGVAKTFSAVEPSAPVAFVGDKRVFFVGRLGTTLDNAAVGDDLWGLDERSGLSYRHLYTIKDGREVEIPAETFLSACVANDGDPIKGDKIQRFLYATIDDDDLQHLMGLDLDSPDPEVEVAESMDNRGLVRRPSYSLRAASSTRLPFLPLPACWTELRFAVWRNFRRRVRPG